ncbi:hypothetical protein BDN72DRAFT_906997 [Pluteus cervinus]|uniref:Uncharacterized protein n=1 Tax=Pluteus cervinus TaxID=181527 RepID=A0ACD2ZXX4_9AGAR|nr:hypothetical protein BDN72DRAFT_906997 [Pluteus cervinus]
MSMLSPSNVFQFPSPDQEANFPLADDPFITDIDSCSGCSLDYDSDRSSDVFYSCPSSPTLPDRAPLSFPELPSLACLTDEFVAQQRKLSEIGQWVQAAADCLITENTVADQARLLDTIGNEFAQIAVELECIESEIQTYIGRLTFIKQDVACRKCRAPCIQPYVLPCFHIFCGQCLEGPWRQRLDVRLDNSMLSGGELARDLLDSFPQTEAGFQRFLRRINHFDKEVGLAFTAYESPCCGELIDSPPVRVVPLSDLCSKLAECTASDLDDGLDEPIYFSRMFSLS